MPLSLTRHKGQALVLECTDGPVTITFVATTDREARVVVDAPPAVRIMRVDDPPPARRYRGAG